MYATSSGRIFIGGAPRIVCWENQNAVYYAVKKHAMYTVVGEKIKYVVGIVTAGSLIALIYSVYEIVAAFLKINVHTHYFVFQSYISLEWKRLHSDPWFSHIT